MDALEQQILDGILEKAEIEEDQLQNFTVDTLLFKSDGGENNLELDSLDALELIALLYETWEIEVMPEDLAQMRTIRQIADFVRAQGKAE